LTFASRSIRLAVAHVARESSPPRLDYEAERDIATWSSRLFDGIAVGESASYARTLDTGDIDFVDMMTGDRLESGPGPVPSAVRSAPGSGCRLR